jgi:hypothetical protein
MFLAVFLSHGYSHRAHVVLHGRIDNKLPVNAMPGQFPFELVLPFRLRVMVSCVDDVLIVTVSRLMTSEMLAMITRDVEKLFAF